MNVMRAVLPVMREQRAGRILNISSVAGVSGFKHCGAYAASKFAVEGLSLSVALEVEQFGIQITVVEPGFFRTELLDASHVKWSIQRIEDYAADGNVQEVWSAYNGKQPGDPDKLGEVLLEVAAMEQPPKVFVAGSDALSLIPTIIDARLKDVLAHESLSRSTDGAY
jgi:NAD(P)-dependent dehydrogenase (short-subunit alcohol dehydrogenase family)